MPNPGISGLVALSCAGGLLLAGCASGSSGGSVSPSRASGTTGATAATGSSSATSTAAPGSPSEPVDDAVEIVVSVRGGKVRPPLQRVKIDQGSEVRLILTSDVDDQVHVHGYDLGAELAAGRAVTVEFTADQAGLVEVETHESGLTLVQLEVR